MMNQAVPTITRHPNVAAIPATFEAAPIIAETPVIARSLSGRPRVRTRACQVETIATPGTKSRLIQIHISNVHFTGRTA